VCKCGNNLTTTRLCTILVSTIATKMGEIIVNDSLNLYSIKEVTGNSEE
jgi:hypothetical protein